MQAMAHVEAWFMGSSNVDDDLAEDGDDCTVVAIATVVRSRMDDAEWNGAFALLRKLFYSLTVLPLDRMWPEEMRRHEQLLDLLQ